MIRCGTASKTHASPRHEGTFRCHGAPSLPTMHSNGTTMTIPSAATATGSQTTTAVSGLLQAKGFEVADFDLNEDEAPAMADAFGLMGGLLRVRCWSTGEVRVYPTGSGSAWLGAFLMDLGGGHFARAARGPRAGLA